MFCVCKAETYGDIFWAQEELCCVHLRTLLTLCFLCCGSRANSCGGSQTVFARVRHLFVYVCVSVHGLLLHLPDGLFYFLVAGAGVRSLPAGSLPVSESAGSSHFLSAGKRKLKGNRMSIPGRTGQGRLGEVEGEGDDPGNGGEDKGYMGAPYPSLYSMLRVDSDVFFDIDKRQSSYSCIFRWNYREIPEWLLDVGSNNQICLNPRFSLIWRSSKHIFGATVLFAFLLIACCWDLTIQNKPAANKSVSLA